MKRTPEELIEEISDFLIVYMKAGKLEINSFIHKAHLQLSQLEQLLHIHFLLKEEVKVFVRELPFLIRRFKTSTTVHIETYHGEIRGQINWNHTIKDRLRMNASDKTIFSVNERNRNYDIPENLVLKEFLQVLYNILNQSIDVDYFKKYDWFSEWGSLKKIVSHTLRKNIYLSRVNLERNMVTDRMIQATTNHRNPLYRKAAELLSLYRKLFSENMDEELFKQLLRETFVFPEKEEVLFELYWVVQLIKHNSKNAELRLIDGRDNLVTSWSDVENTYYLYHDSTGSNRLHFHITVDEMKEYTHPFIDRKVDSMNLAVKIANETFGRGFDTTTLWSGRPDIIVEVYDNESGSLKKIYLGEVKYTTSVDYTITGLKELVDYMKLIKGQKNQFLDDQDGVDIYGLLFSDCKLENSKGVANLLKLDDFFDEKKVRFISLNH